MAPKNPRGDPYPRIFRMLKFDDFIMYSSYTTKIYITSIASSARNSIVEKLAFLGSKGPPLGVIFCNPQKLPLGSTARSLFYWTLMGSPRVYMPYTSSPNPTWGELALGNAQGDNIKSGQSDTRGVTVHQKETSLQHSKGMIPWHHL